MKILIVDDEIIACKGLSSMLYRLFKDDNIEISYFTNPIVALEYVSTNKPDIIFLDILMPEMNGIDFAEKVLKIYLANIVIISGNDDYHFVRQGFMLNICDYLLKPIDEADIINVVTKIKSAIRNSNESIIKSQINEEIQFKVLFLVAIKTSFLSDKIKNELFELKKLSLANGIVDISFSQEKYDNNIFTFKLSNTSDYYVCIKNLLEILNNYFQTNELIIKCAYTPLYKLEQYEDARQKVFEILQVRIYDEHSNCYSIESDSKFQFMDSYEYLIDFSSLQPFLSHTDYEIYNNFLDNWFTHDKLSRLNYKDIKKRYSEILLKITNNNILNNDLNIKNFTEFNTISEIIKELKRIVNAVSFSYSNDSTEINPQKLSFVLEYINKNYNKDLTLASVSNNFNFSYSYFSRIFKAYTGFSFSQYLINLRMEKAKEIIINYNEMKIRDVARIVGYKDNVQTFTRTFKNHFGKAPTFFRFNGKRNQ